jgi:hypothetical protein
LAFPWFFPPKSDVTIFNAGSSAIRAGRLRIGGETREIGALSPGQRRTFRYRAGPEGDFGIQVDFASTSVSDDHFGYIVGIPWPEPQSDVVEVDEQGLRPQPTGPGRD